MLREDGKLAAVTRFECLNSGKGESAASRAKDYVRRHWKYHEPSPEPGDLVARAQSHSLCISGMAFQDAWNIDLARLRRCCVHVVTPAKKLIPFCAYYMTGSTGRGLEFW